MFALLCVFFHMVQTHCSFLQFWITFMLGLTSGYDQNRETTFFFSSDKNTHIHQTIQLNVSLQDNPWSPCWEANHAKCCREAAEILKYVSLRVNKVSLNLGQGAVSSSVFQQFLFGVLTCMKNEIWILQPWDWRIPFITTWLTLTT